MTCLESQRQFSRAAPKQPASLAGGGNLAIALVLLATLAAYLRCLGNGFVFDDDNMIVANRHLGSWSFLWQSMFHDSGWFLNPTELGKDSCYYRPLQYAWLGMNYHLFGLNPLGWHAMMVGLHLVAVFLVFKIACSLTGNTQTGLLAALLFGVMPINAEAVSWAAAIPHSLAGALQLAAFYLLVREDRARPGNRALAWGLYALALLAHESAVTFPAIVAVYVLLFESPGGAGHWRKISEPDGRLFRRTLLTTAPFAIELICYLFVRRFVLGFFAARADVVPNPATNAQILLTAPHVVVTYLLMFLMPWRTGPAHRAAFVLTPFSPEFYLPAAGLAAIMAGLFLTERKHPQPRVFLFCAAWIAIAMAPALYLRGLYQLVHDDYLYLAAVGWCMLAADCAIRLAQHGPNPRRIALAGAGAYVLVCGVSLWNVQRFWRDDLVLFSRWVEEVPESANLHAQLGLVLLRNGDLPAAERELSEAVNLNPEGGEGLYDLGVVHVRQGRVREGAAEISAGLKRLPHPPAESYAFLAALYQQLGDQQSSEAALRQSQSARQATPPL